jgi:pyruvate/2-oxoglutarate/acetoin dehydrogenase E1 component
MRSCNDGGVSLELIDLRSVDLPSIDYETIGVLLKKTGAVVIVEETADGQGIGHRIAAETTRRFFDDLDAPPACLSSLGVPLSVSRVLEAAQLLIDQQILAGVEATAKRR